MIKNIKIDTDNIDTELFYRNLNYSKYIKENNINIIFKFMYMQDDIKNANDDNTIYIFCDYQDIRIKYKELEFYFDFVSFVSYNHISFKIKNSINSNNLKDYKFIYYFIKYYKNTFRDLINLNYKDDDILDKIWEIQMKININFESDE